MRRTAEFMAMFYHNWLEQDLTPAEALRTAQTDAKAAGMDPRHWAAFVLMEN